MAIFAVAVFQCLPALARTYYVSNAGSDSDPGTQAQPFATIQQAANVVNPGDTVIVEPGTWTSSSQLTPVVTIERAGTAAQPIIFECQTKWQCVISGQNNTTAYGFDIAVANAHVVIRGFDISGFGNANAGGSAAIEGSGGVGQYTTITENNIHNIGNQCTDGPYGQDGIYFNAANITITHNQIHDIGRYGPGQNGCNPSTQYYANHDQGIYMGDGYAVDGWVIDHNTFYNVSHAWPIQCQNSVSANSEQITYNDFLFPNPYRDGQIVLICPLNGGTISNNVLWQPTNESLYFDGGSATDVIVSNNITYQAVICTSCVGQGFFFFGNTDNASYATAYNAAITIDPSAASLLTLPPSPLTTVTGTIENRHQQGSIRRR